MIGGLTAEGAHGTRRVATRTATKNQLLGQLDRSFPELRPTCRTKAASDSS
jgi:transposase